MRGRFTTSLPRPHGSSCAASASRRRSLRRIRRRPIGRTRGKLILRLAIMAVLLALVFGGFYAYERFREVKTAEFFANMKPPPVPVVAVAATTQALPQSFGGIGSLVAVHQVTVSPEIGGRITKIFFEAGATVRAGDPLVQLNDEPEQGDLLNFRAQARIAQINLARARELASR